MPVSYVPSAEQHVLHKKSTARKRQRNQNTEISELGDLLPLHTSQSVDKISVLRVTSSYMRFRGFMKTVYDENATTSYNGFSEMLSMALDGFLLVTDKDANILYVSENITDYVGLSQLDVIGQSLFDMTHSEEEDTIKKNLKPQGISPNQSRQFYMRFKSTVSPGRMQMSHFNSHIMVQVSGKLKFLPDPTVEGGGEVTGLVAECRLIESSSSILEISIPQSYFTSTVSLDCTIISVDAKVEELIGFTVEDFIGTKMSDYFHPAEHELHDSSHFVSIMMRTGHFTTPLFRFMTCTGEWVWMQAEAFFHYKAGTNTPDYMEVKSKVVNGYSGKLRLVETKERYGASKTVDPAVMKDPHRDAYFHDQLPNKPYKDCVSIIKALQGTSMCGTTIDAFLHSRELGLQELPTCIEKYVPPDHMIPPEFKHLVPASPPQSSSSTSPAQTLSPQSSPLASTLTPSPPSFISHTSESLSLTSSYSVVSPPSVGSCNGSVSSIQSPASVFTNIQSPDSGISCETAPPSVCSATFEQSGSVSSSEDLGFFSPAAGPVLPLHGVSADAMLVGATSFQQPPLDPNHQIPQTQTNGFLTADFTTVDTSGSLLSSGNEDYGNPDLLMSADPGLLLGNGDSEVLEQLLGEMVSLNGQAISAAVPTGEVPLLTNNGYPPDAFLGNVVQPTTLVYGTAQAVDTVAPAMFFKPQDQSAKPNDTNFELPQQNDDLQEFLHELMNLPP